MVVQFRLPMRLTILTRRLQMISTMTVHITLPLQNPLPMLVKMLIMSTRAIPSPISLGAEEVMVEKASMVHMMKLDGKLTLMRTRRKTQNTILVMEERRTLMSIDQAMEEKVSMERKPQHTTLVMDEIQPLMSMGPVDMVATPYLGMEGKASTRRKVQNTSLVTDDRLTRVNMNLVDMGVDLHPVMNQGTEETVMTRRKTQNTILVMDERQTLMSMDLVGTGRRRTTERKRTVGMAMEGNQLVMGVQTTRQRGVKATGHHLRGLVMEGLRKRTTESPAMGGVTMIMKAMVARNMVMMTLMRMRSNAKGVATIASTLMIE